MSLRTFLKKTDYARAWEQRDRLDDKEKIFELSKLQKPRLKEHLCVAGDVDPSRLESGRRRAPDSSIALDGGYSHNHVLQSDLLKK